jgi:uncharacterized protein (TIRG00374 family)
MLITFLIFSIGIKNLILTFIGVSFVPGLMTGLCMFTLYFLGALNIWLLLRINNRIPFYPYLKLYSYSWIASLITPGQAGDASLVLLLKKQGIPVYSTGIIYLIDKGITLFFFSLIALYGSLWLVPELKSMFPLIILIICLSLLISFLVIFFLRNTKWGAALQIRLNIKRIITEFTLLKAKWHMLLLNFLITIIKWLIMTLAFYLAFLSFHTHLSFPEIGVIPVISTLVGYIPVSIAGIGTVEITAGYLFLKIGIMQSVVLSSYIFLRTLQYLLALLILCALTFFKKKE